MTPIYSLYNQRPIKKIITKCRRCKRPIYEGTHCSVCKELIYQETMEKQTNRALSKLRSTIAYGIGKVKEVADGKFWATSHANCFRATISVDPNTGKWKGESEEHVDKQYERWKYHRKLNRTVYCNLILRRGMGKPDLIVVDTGFIFIEEIVKSEKEASIIEKRAKYPFQINIIKITPDPDKRTSVKSKKSPKLSGGRIPRKI